MVVCGGNEGPLSLAGVPECGARLVAEIRAALALHRPRFVSLVGFSFGGVLMRYAAAELMREGALQGGGEGARDALDPAAAGPCIKMAKGATAPPRGTAFASSSSSSSASAAVHPVRGDGGGGGAAPAPIEAPRPLAFISVCAPHLGRSAHDEHVSVAPLWPPCLRRPSL